MAQDKKQVEQIIDMEVDSVKRFADVCKKAELIDYSSIKGMFILHPYGYAIWENFQKILGEKFREIGHENVYLPILIPESLPQKGKDHVEGFAPKCAQMTMGGSEKLEERYCICPISEALFRERYTNIIHSHWDLPKLHSQQCSILRWKKISRPFLRHWESLWQEGHIIHVIIGKATTETERMFNIYADFCENYLATPVVKGRKTDKGKFSGTETTYTVEYMMRDKKALQAGTSHYFSDGFVRAFDITFAGKGNQPHRLFQTSWDVSIRLVGGVIMTHGDDNGLVLPPRTAPTQVIITPAAQHKESVVVVNKAVMARLETASIRVKMDVSDNSPGREFTEYEMKGALLRLELGPKDVEKGQRVLARRGSDEKVFVSLDNIEETVKTMLGVVRQGLFNKAKCNLDENAYICATLEKVEEEAASQGGFAETMWHGELVRKLKMKKEAGVSSRCIPLEQEHPGDICACCGKSAKRMVCWGVTHWRFKGGRHVAPHIISDD